MADKRISQLVDRGTVENNDVIPIVVSAAVTTNKATISSIQTFMQGNLDLGVTSVGITLGSTGTDVSVSGSPVTSSGNITINLPTASATNRGLLSAADWTTFNSKQQAITLTTTGTSGAATLVSGALNIPNYSTDLSGYVTLGTAQTITAQKTFTTSGNSDTMIISHGSGSGFALDAIKAGNGEVIRVNKTSGTGNAMTVIGGNFEAPTIVKTGGLSTQYLKADGSVSTLTNPVTGTGVAGQVAYWSGTNSQAGSNNLFWDNAAVKLGIGTNTPEGTGLTVAGGGVLISLDSGAARKVLELYASSTGAKLSSSYVGSSSYGDLELLTGGLARLTLASTGAATFSSSVITSGGGFIANMASTQTPALLIDRTSTGHNGIIKFTTGGVDKWILGNRNTSDETFRLFSYTAATDILILASTGAATFSGAVRVNGSYSYGSFSVLGTQGLSWSSVGNDIAFGLATIGTATTGASLWVHTPTPLAGWTSGLGVDGTTDNSTLSTIQLTAYGLKFAGYNSKLALRTTNGTTITNALVLDGASSGAATFSSLGTGTVTATAGTISTVSDSSYKVDDGFINSAIEKVLQLKPRYFYWNEKSGLPMDLRQLGFYAQEVNQALGEEAANTPQNENTPWGISDRSIIAMLTKAIQELKTEIDSLKNQIK